LTTGPTNDSPERAAYVRRIGCHDNQQWWNNCHGVLQEEDCALLEWLLEQIATKVITLEYWKDTEQARVQILRLNRLIGQVKAAGPQA
jgi:hypothetical protein